MRSAGNPPPGELWDAVGALALGVTGSAGVNPGPVTSIAAPLADWNAGLWLEEGFDPSPPRVPFAGLSCDPISSDPARAGKDTESLDAAIAGWLHQGGSRRAGRPGRHERRNARRHRPACVAFPPVPRRR